jgi:hypothetical protein
MHAITHSTHLMLRFQLSRIKPKSKVFDKSEMFDNTFFLRKETKQR